MEKKWKIQKSTECKTYLYETSSLQSQYEILSYEPCLLRLNFDRRRNTHTSLATESVAESSGCMEVNPSYQRPLLVHQSGVIGSAFLPASGR